MSGKKIIRKWLTLTLSALVILFFSLTFLTLLGQWIFQAIGALLLGWFTHLTRVIPLLDWNAELIFCFLLALTLATWMLHRALNWLHKQGTLNQAWTPKRTLALTSLLLMLFGMSVAMTGIVHQSIWVMKGPITRTNRASELTNALNSGKNIFSTSFSYAKEHDGHYPSGLRLLLENDSENEDWQELSLGDLYYQPKNKDLPPEPWVYYPWTTSHRTNLITLHSSSPAFNGRWIVGQLNGAVQTVSNEEFQEMLATTQAALRRKRTAGHPHGPSPSHPRQRVVPPQ